MNVGSANERQGRVAKRSWGLDSELVGRAHANPLFDTREYDIELMDGSVNKYTLTIIAENTFAQVDDEVNQHLLMNDITYNRKDNIAIPISDGMTRGHNGNESPKITTCSWKLLVEWKYGSTSWMKLKDLKESRPIEVAEYSVANLIVEETTIKWWVPQTICKRNRIISKVKSRYWQTTHKCGIRFPKTTEEALQIDKIAGTDFLRKAINK